MWLFTSKPAADRKLAIPYSGPWRVTKQLADTLRSIQPEGNWCRQPKEITVSLNRLKRCYGEARAPQQVDHDLCQLEDAEDGAEGPMGNAWVTYESSAATQALNQEAGDVHAPSLREKTTSAATPQPSPCFFSRHRNVEYMAPSIVVHHEHSTSVGPRSDNSTHKLMPKVDSTTMTDPGVSTPSTLAPGPPGAWPAPRTQRSFDQSALVRPCSSQVLDAEESTLPPVLEELYDEVFVSQPVSSSQPASPPHPSPQTSRPSSTTAATPSSTTTTAPSATDTTTEADSGA